MKLLMRLCCVFLSVYFLGLAFVFLYCAWYNAWAVSVSRTPGAADQHNLVLYGCLASALASTMLAILFCPILIRRV